MVADTDEERHRLARHRVALDLVKLERAVALVAGQAGERDARGVRDRPGERQGLGGRRDTAPVHALVDVDHQPKGAPRRDGGLRELRHLDRVVDRDGHARLAGEQGEGARLLDADGLVDDEHVVDAGPRHHDGLPDRRTADADRALLDLQAGDVRALVHLDVRPQPRGRAAHAGGHHVEIGPELGEVEQEGRG